MKRTALLICIAFCLLFCSCANLPQDSQSSGQYPDSSGSLPEESSVLPEIEVAAAGIGKADAILINTKDAAVLIDTGEAEDADKVCAFLDARKVDSIEYLILTHLDKDHIGGAARIINSYDVKHIVQPDYFSDSEDYADYTGACRDAEILPKRLSEVFELNLGQAYFRLLPAREDSYAEENDYSVMTELVYGEKRFLFAGDAEEKRLAEYLGSQVSSFDYLKVPHHGKKVSNSREFFEAVKPKYAVITCSDKNPPDNEVLDMLSDAGAEICLASDKAVSFICNGAELYRAF